MLVTVIRTQAIFNNITAHWAISLDCLHLLSLITPVLAATHLHHLLILMVVPVWTKTQHQMRVCLDRASDLDHFNPLSLLIPIIYHLGCTTSLWLIPASLCHRLFFIHLLITAACRILIIVPITTTALISVITPHSIREEL